MSTKETVPVFFAVNDPYAAALGVAIKSLTANANPDRQYQLIILNQGLRPEHVKKIKQLATPNVSIDFESMAAKIQECLSDNNNTLRADYFTLTIYYRLFIAEMFPEIKRAVYIDADVIVLDDIGKLYDTDLQGNMIGAALDPVIGTDALMSNYSRNAVGVPAERYVNSGVLLMDLQQLRQRDFAGHFLNLLNTYHFNSIAPDQDYINAIATDRMFIIDSKWDVENGELAGTKLIHYNLYQKPWRYAGMKGEEAFWKYAPATPFNDELRANLAIYDTPEHHQEDDQHFKDLLARADRIAAETGTFHEVQEQTGKVRL
ncbi:glycosyltransferase family 8 protein [Lacticaseibacillus zhaodongensis]|uniref:glycosyltransferase family 8 protein n=1 Tax=Lacticaseibacillus zhaodongensis TaxID=2668065 RepID=UPI0012D2C2E8|nr:glycosyltransferase family 8 protein [Lacticaseibacillus zhaodongensis]